MPNQTNVNNGLATLTVHETLLPGTYTITGHYNGSSNYEESEGQAELEVLKKSTTTTISSSKATYSTSEDVILHVHVVDSKNASITTGSYILYEGTTQLQTGVVNGGDVAVNLGKRAVGVKTYQVIYQENDVYVGSTSNTVEITVSKAEVTVTCQSMNMYLEGDNVCYVTVTDETGDIVSEGSVSLKISGKTVKDSDGKAIITRVNMDGIYEVVFPQQPATWNLDSTYPVTVTYSGTVAYNRSDVSFTLAPTNNHPNFTEFLNLQVLSSKEAGLILCELECETDASNDFLFQYTFLDKYLQQNPLVLEIVLSTGAVYGYVIGLDPTDMQIPVIRNNYDMLYVISNFENSDGRIDIADFQKDENSTYLNINMSIDSTYLPNEEDVVYYCVQTLDYSLYIEVNVEGNEE